MFHTDYVYAYNNVRVSSIANSKVGNAATANGGTSGSAVALRRLIRENTVNAQDRYINEIIQTAAASGVVDKSVKTFEEKGEGDILSPSGKLKKVAFAVCTLLSLIAFLCLHNVHI